ncbi:N-acylneuraminate cytidylyltransferase [Clostridium carnis]
MEKAIENLICIIPARAGSKGLKSKNMLYLAGKPLIFHTIDAAIESGLFKNENIYVSTDSLEYKEILEANRPIKVVLRDPKLATDESTTFDVLEDFFKDFDDNINFVLCQPTSPLRTGETIIKAYEDFINSDCDNLVSFSQSDKALKLFSKIGEDGCPADMIGVDNGYRRQAAEKHYYSNGAIYISKKKEYIENKSFFTKNTKAFIMDKRESIDVDDKDDFIRAVGSIYFDYKKREIDNKSFYKEKYINFSNELLHNKLIIGDSRMEKINLNGFSNISVGGITLHTVYENIDLILSNRNFDEALVTLGVNDLITKYSIESIKDKFEKLISNLLDKNIKVTLSKIIYTIFRAEVDNEDIIELNKYLDKLAKEKNITIINPNEVVCVNNKLKFEYTTDGLHMNDEAKNLLKDFYKKELNI